jgi:acetyltransferase-like isoleucine patch superfamily enzyme
MIKTMVERPAWATTEHASATRLAGLLANELRAAFDRYVRFRGDRSAYLRSLGARVGVGCEILTSPSNFGTEPWLVEIGDRVTLSQEVLLVTHDGSSRLFREKYSESPWGNKFGPIRVLDNSFVGARAIILPNVSIGPNAIVAAGSVVTKDVPPETVWGGVPARQLSTLAEVESRYERNMVPISARDRDQLRKELTQYFFGAVR